MNVIMFNCYNNRRAKELATTEMKMTCYEESNTTNGREKRISQDPSTFKRKIIEPWHKTEIMPKNWNSE